MEIRPRTRLWATNVFALIVIFLICFAVYFFSTPNYDWICGNPYRNSQTQVLNSNTVITQPFTVAKNNFSGMQLIFYKQDISYSEDSSVILKLASSTTPDTIITVKRISANEIKDGELFTFHFDPIRTSFLQNYILTITTENLADGITVASSILPQSPSLAYEQNNNVVGTLIFYMGFSRRPLGTQVYINLLILTFLIWLIYIYRKRLWKFLAGIPLNKGITFLILLFGLLFIFVEPPLHMFDEPEHFRRVWSVSNGIFTPQMTNGYVEVALPEYIQNTFARIFRSTDGTTQNPIQLFEMLAEKAGDNNRLSTTTGQSTMYSYFAYLFMALFLKLGILLKLSPLGLIYMVRLASLLQYIGLTGWALSIARTGKNTIASFSVLGLLITQGVAINVDSLLFGGTFLFLAALVNIAFTEENHKKATLPEILGLIFGAFCILIAKHVYFPILALVFIIPSSKFGSKTKKILIITAFFIIAGLFSIYLQSLFSIPNTDPRINYTNINFSKQVNFIIKHPLNFLYIVQDTLNKNAFEYAKQYFLLNGTFMTSGFWGIVQSILLLAFAWPQSQNERISLTTTDYFIILSIILSVLLLIVLPLYLTWTPIAANTISGLQGRYFAPIIILVLLLFKPPFLNTKNDNSAFLLCSMSFVLVNLLWTTVLYFY